MSAPLSLSTYRVTVHEEATIVIEVDATNAEEASDKALLEYRHDPELYLMANGSVTILRCRKVSKREASR